MIKEGIEAIYGLSPMQQGLLFHSLLAPESGAYFHQIVCTLKGDLNRAAMEKAWAEVMKRHSILRSSFVWQRLPKPLQVVHLSAPLPLSALDWQHLSPDQREPHLQEFLRTDQHRGFRFTHPPLMRLTLMHLAPNLHQLVWSHHHLLLDGWSLPLVLSEVFAVYEATAQGRAVTLPPAKPFRDYITWLQQQDMTGAERFWRKTLAGFGAPTPLPEAGMSKTGGESGSDADEERARGGATHERQRWLSRATTERLHQFARRHQLTANTVMQGAWALLLARHSREREVVFGVTVSGRPAELGGVERMVGLFINTLPVRVRVDGRERVVAWLRGMQVGQVEMRQYEYSPLVEVQGWSEVERGRGLFESLFVFENYPVEEELRGGGAERRAGLEIGEARAVERTNYGLTVVCGPGERMSVRISYRAEAYEAGAVERMLEQMERVVEQMVEGGEARVGELEMVSAREREQFTRSLNETAKDYAAKQTLIEMFEDAVARYGEAVAIESEGEQLTYGELNRRANQLAHYLRKQGVRPETLVGLMVERGVEMVVGLLGVLKAGGAYVPLDPAYPQERLAFMMEDSGVSVLLTQEHLRERVAEHRAAVVCVDSDAGAIAEESVENVESGATHENLAYVIYTSGSTGKPKGALVTQANVVRLFKATEAWFGFKEDDVWSLFHSYAFDFSVWELWGALLYGGRVVVVPYLVSRSPEAFYELLCSRGVTVLNQTPSAFRQLMQTEEILKERGKLSLRYIIFGGEALELASLKPWFERHGDARPQLVNMYGITETTVHVTYRPLSIEDVEREAGSLIGVPIPDLRAYVIDHHGQLAPVGVGGEVYVSGAGLGRGYWKRAELTAERFVPDAFGTQAGTRLYKTGDLARRLPDGSLEYLGRTDQQVKIRGFRIELGEIEGVIEQHAGVRETVVIAREDSGGDKRLVAYVVSNSGDAPDVAELRNYVRERLPEYMVPSAFVWMEKIPLTHHGKVDRRALPEPESKFAGETTSYVAPRNSVEEMLAGMWCEVLGVERVGIEDSFFEVGGHSLMATQLTTRVREAFGTDVPLRTLFEAPTVREFAVRIEAAMKGAQGMPAAPIERADRDGEAALSFSQQRLWFMDQLEPESAAYNIARAVKLAGALKTEALERAFDEVVRRHEALRTNFLTVEGKAVQRIARDTRFSLPFTDLSLLSETERDAELARRVRAEAQQPFNLAEDVLLRISLLQLREDEHVVLLTMHHIISDGWSMNVLIHEVATLYAAFSSDEASPLPELPIQYFDYAQWQRAWLSGAVLEAQLGYWKRQLSGSPPALELPTDHPRPAMQTFNGSMRSANLSRELSQRLKKLSTQEGATLFMTLLAAFQTLLSRYTGQSDISVGTPIANRTRAEMENLIGFFVNTQVMRTDLSGNPAFREVLRRVRETALGAYAHQDVPFEMLVEELQPERNLSRTPLYQVMFTLENDTMNSIQMPGLTLKPLAVESETAKFDLTMWMVETDEGLTAALEYNTDLFEEATVNRMLSHFETLLEAIAANADTPIADLPLLAHDEEQSLLREWSTKVGEFSRLCIHEAVEAQAARNPDAVAVVYQDQQLTFGELNRRANQLAHHLRTLNVAPEVPVGVCMARSVDLPVALLGVLKAGGAYVPLDASYPSERLAFMLEDSDVPVLLTQSALAEQLPAVRARVLCLDTEWQAIDRHSNENPAATVSNRNLAYVIYTSGSTGKPKGTACQHEGVMNLLADFDDRAPLVAGSAHCFWGTFSFDVSVYEIFSSLVAGGTLHIVPEEIRTDSFSFFRWLRVQKIESTYITPSMLRDVADWLTQDANTLSLRRLLVGVEPIEQSLLETIMARVPGLRIVNGYGPTEATICATLYSLPAQTGGDRRTPIGQPVRNYDVYLLDRNLQPVPVGVPGELHIGGVGLARGYVSRPDMTAERFIPHPHNSRRGERLYRTGDIARWLSDGNIEYIGRADHQVKVRGYRIELGEIETALDTHEAVREAVAVAREDTAGGGKRLVCYCVMEDGAQFNAAELREHLRTRLPDYMVPAAVVLLEEMPLTPNGKVNRKALPAPDYSREQLGREYVAPRDAAEEVLAGIWAGVLNVKQVGVNDNYFELGGDSILSIQIIARANQSGLHLTPKQLFQHQTIAELAAVAGASQVIAAEQGSVTGSLPLTPIQHWFFEQNLPDANHFNQSVMLEIREAVDETLLRRVAQKLVEHHDALRTRFFGTEAGWQQTIPAQESAQVFSSEDFSHLGDEELSTAIETIAQRTQTRLNLSDGPLMRVVFFNAGAHRAARLLIVVHHQVIDGVSWRILLDDLHTGYAQSQRGEEISLPMKTTSFKHWSERLQTYAQSDALKQESAFWLNESRNAAGRLPVDNPDGVNTSDSARTLSVTLSVEATRGLLRDVPNVYRTQINDALLAALIWTYAAQSGQTSLLVDLEGHGREELFADVDLSRTVGWFTTLYPVPLTLENGSSPAHALKQVKEQLRAIPNRGIGYGLLRYLGDAELGKQLRALPTAEIIFNYLGQFDQVLPKDSAFAPAGESSGKGRSASGHRSHLLEVDASVGNGQLQVNWTYSENVHRRATIENLAADFINALEQIVSFCRSHEAVVFTPSDFPLAGLNQPQLDMLVEENGDVEDIYPLSPMQQGLFFHSLLAPDASQYFEQLTCQLLGNLNIDAFEKAWAEVMKRHSILRSSFVWQRLPKPLQVVHLSAPLPLSALDWQHLSPDQREPHLQEFLRTDQHRGFRFTHPPLMRLTLMHLAPNLHQLVWSHHHLLLDGWSLPLVLSEVFAVYEATAQGRAVTLPPAKPFRDYITWLQQQDMTGAERFWRKTLAGFGAPTPLPEAGMSKTGGESGSDADEERARGGATHERQRWLSRATTERLHQFARRHQLTANTVMQGAWALLLARHSREREVVFGVTVSGRPAELGGVERMVGLFINTLPVRVRVDGRERVVAWLRGMQVGQVEMRQYEYSPLVEVQGWSEVERGRGLFESLFVFENYPVEEELRGGGAERRAGLEIGEARAVERTNYGLTVVCGPGERMSVRISYRAEAYEAGAVERMLEQMERVVEQMVEGGEARVGELEMMREEEREAIVRGWNETGGEYAAERTVAEMFEEMAEKYAGEVVIESEGEAATYGELNERANQLAHYLRKQGVRPETLVGLMVERGVEMVVGVLGVLKAGGAYVPLDPAYPQERLTFMMEDSGAKVLLTQQKLVDRLPVQDMKVVCVDSDREDIEGESKDDFQSGAGSRNAAYVIYTSGSTGKPKGTLLEHRGVCNLAKVQERYFDVGVGEKVLLFASISFDASVFDMILATLAGGTLYVPSQETLLIGESLGDLLREKKITAVTLPPSVLATLSPEKLPDLKTLIVAGEACSAELVAQWSEGRNFVNGYGPTEATVCATLGTSVDGTRKPDIGGPVTNKKIYILDEQHQPVPVGMTGEMHIGGVGQARCYLNRQELTAEKFIPDPFGTEPGARMYKTGDLARYLPDGRIDYVGRIDHQVKIRGFRIELNEIEEVLMQHAGVRDAVVLAHSERAGVTRLVGYVVVSDEELTADVVRSFTREQLPEFMVPSAIVLLDEMPLSPNGKVDQRALPAPDWTSATPERVYVAPRTPDEEKLAQIWSDVLGVEQVGVTDNFFEIGGHSLLATQVVSRVRETFETELPLRKLFEKPTVETLAEALAEHLAASEQAWLPDTQKITHKSQSIEQQLADLDQLSEDEVKALVEMELELIGDDA